jgi:hypothetical protein
MAKAHPKFTRCFFQSNVRPNAISTIPDNTTKFCSMEPNQEPEPEIDPSIKSKMTKSRIDQK